MFFDNSGDIFYVNRDKNGWSNSIKLTPLINTNQSEAVHSIVNDGSIYFSRFNSNAQNRETAQEIFVSRKKDGRYTKPLILGKTINSDNAQEMSVYVHKDETFMIIEETKDNRLCQLYLCKNTVNGKWTERKLIPTAWSRYPSISPDGKYIFFMRRNGIYWVSAKIIEDLK